LFPAGIFLYQINFNLSTLVAQLGMQAHDHRIVSTDLKNHPLINSFWFRFFPHYREQPLMWLVYMFSFFLIPYLILRFKLFRKLKDIHLIGFLALTITLFFFASPQYRYLPPWLLLVILFSIRLPQINWQHKFIVPFLTVVAFNSFLSFGGRHVAALIQRPQRNADSMLHFIHKNIPQNQQKTLIWGESIGSYYCNGFVKKNKQVNTHATFDYAIEIYPQHWNNRKYNQVFLITQENRPNLQLIATYKVNPYFEIPAWAKSFAKGGTYDGTKIYRLAP
jgi:hypothetical protein